jgi:excinuclease ABC subunit C
MLIDGGKGQLSQALASATELGLAEDVAIVGLAKSRLKGLGAARRESGERIFLPGREDPIALAEGAPETLLVAAARDEAHRFAIGYHRKSRGKITSELDAILGVGPARRRALLRHFGSLTALKAATLEQVSAVPGVPAEVAQKVFEQLRARVAEGQPRG